MLIILPNYQKCEYSMTGHLSWKKLRYYIILVKHSQGTYWRWRNNVQENMRSILSCFATWYNMVYSLWNTYDRHPRGHQCEWGLNSHSNWLATTRLGRASILGRQYLLSHHTLWGCGFFRLSKVSANERRGYICKAFFHMLRPCLAIFKKKAQSTLACHGYAQSPYWLQGTVIP